MNTRWGYAWEKFGNAVNGMAASPLRLQDRICNAFLHHLARLEMDERNYMPPELMEQWRALSERVGREAARHASEGAIEATCALMSDADAEVIAREIVSINSSLDVLSHDDP